jgi:outer membrane receptor protein involved in Fe transport
MMTIRKASRALALGGLMAGAGFNAMGQEPVRPGEGDVAEAAAPANGVIVYPISFFAEYRPSVASDLTSRIPGFTYKGGDDVRGFGGAAGNVLIDGERPSSKAVSLDETLKRLPVSQIDRVELIRGGAPGVDMQGYAVLANIIRKQGAASTFALEYAQKTYSDHVPGVLPRLEGSTQIGGLKLSGAMTARVEKQQAESGSGYFVRRSGGPKGPIVAEGPFHANIEQRTYAANGSAEYGAFRLNIGGQRDEFPRTERAELVNPLGVRNTEQTVNDLNQDKAEIGADYQRPLGYGMTGRFVGLYTYKDSDLTSVSTGRGAIQQSTKKAEGSESILRGTVRGLYRSMTLEAGGEIAINRLDVASSLKTGGAPVFLPSANVQVAEDRGEVFANVATKLTPRLTLDAGLRIERSTITQSGDVSKEKTLQFAKPRFTLAYELTPSSQLRMRVERTIGQLNFEDFAASGDLSNGAQNVGNSNLEPEQAWESELAWEQRFWVKGALVLTATHSAVSQVSDVIPIVAGGTVFDAPGNLGKGTKDELVANLNVPFDPLGWKGLLLRLNWTWRTTEVKDPSTGRDRPFSLLNPWEGQVFLTQDLPALKSSVTVNTMPMGNRPRQFRSNEYRADRNLPYLNMSWLWRPRPNLQLQLQYENTLARERLRERLIYAGGRATGVVATAERRSAEMTPFVLFRVRRTY